MSLTFHWFLPTNGDGRHLDGEVQRDVVADAHDGGGLGADLAHDALGSRLYRGL